MKRFEGKVVVVTGSGQGIGRGIALYFARNGAAIVTNNRKPLDMKKVRASYTDLPEAEQEKLIAMRGDAQTTADQIRKEGGQAVPCYADVSKADDAKRLIDTAISAFGRIDILVNNAAGLGQGTVLSTTEAQWDMMTQVKMKGAFLTMHNAVPYMIKQGGGTIFLGTTIVIALLGIAAYGAITWYMLDRRLNLDYPYSKLANMITITNPSNTHVLYVSVKSPDPEEAKIIADTYAQVAREFIAARMDMREPNIFEEAKLPDKPVSPSKTRDIVIGFILGALIAMVIIAIKFFSDDRIFTSEDINKVGNIATLGLGPLQDFEHNEEKGAPSSAYGPRDDEKDRKGGRE